MFLVLFVLFMVLPWALSDNVSTKPGLKIFRDEYKSITAACLDLGFAKKACNSGSYTGILSHLAEDLLSLWVSASTCVLVVRSSVDMSSDILIYGMGEDGCYIFCTYFSSTYKMWVVRKIS